MRPTVLGVGVDPQTRCDHYHSPVDIVAIRMKCCGAYFACRACHDALADHPAQVWPREAWDQVAILCGSCGDEMSIARYLACGDECPRCQARFNPGCRSHHHLYFEAEGS
jgi:uncharacterized CHY-type Zn-finger protein